jgi:hypothetical protein
MRGATALDSECGSPLGDPSPHSGGWQSNVGIPPGASFLSAPGSNPFVPSALRDTTPRQLIAPEARPQ